MATSTAPALSGDAPAYERHRPEQTPLYALIDEHFPRFLQRLEAEGVSLPHFVKEEFEAYLKCGRFDTKRFDLTADDWRRFPWPVHAVVSSLGRGRYRAGTAAVKNPAALMDEVGCRYGFPRSAGGTPARERVRRHGPSPRRVPPGMRSPASGRPGPR